MNSLLLPVVHQGLYVRFFQNEKLVATVQCMPSGAPTPAGLTDLRQTSKELYFWVLADLFLSLSRERERRLCTINLQIQ